MSKILLTGGTGLLGQELQKHITCDAPSHKELDITDPKTLTGKYDMVIHAAAYTDVAAAEQEKDKCYKINFHGTVNLLKAYKCPFVFISSEYAHEPINIYSESKSMAEKAVASMAETYLIIRTLFKPRPFLYKQAFADQWTQGDYVDVIAKLVADEIEEWDSSSYLVYIGTGRKTIYDLAKRTKPNVKPISIKDIKEVNLPADYL